MQPYQHIHHRLRPVLRTDLLETEVLDYSLVLVCHWLMPSASEVTTGNYNYNPMTGHLYNKVLNLH